jgi:hypothetical protein
VTVTRGGMRLTVEENQADAPPSAMSGFPINEPSEEQLKQL